MAEELFVMKSDQVKLQSLKAWLCVWTMTPQSTNLMGISPSQQYAEGRTPTHHTLKNWWWLIYKVLFVVLNVFSNLCNQFPLSRSEKCFTFVKLKSYMYKLSVTSTLTTLNYFCINYGEQIIFSILNHHKWVNLFRFIWIPMLSVYIYIYGSKQISNQNKRPLKMRKKIQFGRHLFS